MKSHEMGERQTLEAKNNKDENIKMASMKEKIKKYCALVKMNEIQ